MGAKVKKKDIVSTLSKLATRGKHKQNAERDLQRMVRRVGYSLKARIESAPVHLWDPTTNEVYKADLPDPWFQSFTFLGLEF